MDFARGLSPSITGPRDTTRETVTIAISVISTALALLMVSIRLCSSLLITRKKNHDDCECFGLYMSIHITDFRLLLRRMWVCYGNLTVTALLDVLG